MPLQDTPPFSSAAFIDPKTGQPYPYGSPGYQQAELAMLEPQLQHQAESAANARGTFYSGPALADEQQAAAQLEYQMAQQGAAQSEAEKVTAEQQAFQQQMQREAEAAQAANLQQQGASNMKAGAIQGGLGSLGQLGGLYTASKLGFFGNHSPVTTPGGGGGAGVDAAAQGMPGNDMAAMYQGESTPGSEFGGMYGAPGPAAAPDSGFLSSAEAAGGPMEWGGAGLASLPGAIYASQAANRAFGSSPEQSVGSGLGGLAGFAGGNMVAGPVGGMAGAAAGSFLGNELAKHPGEATPFTAPLMIPQVRSFLQPVGNAFNTAGQDTANFFKGLF